MVSTIEDFSAVGYIINNVAGCIVMWRVFSTLGMFSNVREYHQNCGGYHQYIVRYSALFGGTTQYCGGYSVMQMVLEYVNFLY